MFRLCTLVLILAICTTGFAQRSPLPPDALLRLGTLDFRHGGAVRSLAVSGDGRFVASGSWDRAARVWDRRGREVARVKHEHVVVSAAITRDGGLVASGEGKRILLWEPRTGKSTPVPFVDPMQLRFSPDGKR